MSDPSTLSNDQLMALLGAQQGQGLGSQLPPVFGVGQASPTGSTPLPVQQTSLPPLSGPAALGLQPGKQPDLGSLSNDQIKAYLGIGGEPSMSVGEDMARTIPGALGRVASGLVGAPGDLINLATNAAPFLYHEAKNALMSPTGMDAADKASPFKSYNYADEIGFPTSEQENGGVQALAGTYHQPQSWPARATDTAIQMLPMAAFPADGLGVRAARVLMPAAGSEAAGEASHGQPFEPYARLAGALAGGGGAALTDQVANAPNIILANALRGSTPADTAAARAAMQNAQGVGVPITPAEALGGKSLNLQNYVENQRRLPSQVDQFFAQRPAQVSQAVGNFADSVAPASVQPSMVGQRAQTAAQGGLDNVRQTINGVASQAYDALPGQEIPQADFQQLLQNPSYQGALQALRSNPELNGPIAHLPDNNLAVVNETQKQLGTMQTAAQQTAMNPGGNNTLAGLRGAASGQADALARALSPDYADAHDIVSQGRSAMLDPLQAGPAGSIASTPAIKSQTAALYPSAPPEGASNETAQTIRLLQGQDPAIAADLTRQHLMNTFNESAQDLQGGQNQYGGAKWVAQTAGNPEQRAALETGLATLNPALSGPYSDLAEALRATGRRTQPGSQTAFNQEMSQAMHMTPAPSRFLAGALDPLEWGRHLDNAVGGGIYRRNVGQLANFLTSMPPADAEQYMNQAIQRGMNRAPMSAQIPLQIQAGNQQ